ncbi:MAG: hypothetical protein ABI794_10035 [Betaproteobacteria bacterium]
MKLDLADPLGEKHIYAGDRDSARSRWILGMALELRAKQSAINVSDAINLGDGLVTQARLDRALPQGAAHSDRFKLTRSVGLFRRVWVADPSAHEVPATGRSSSTGRRIERPLKTGCGRSRPGVECRQWRKLDFDRRVPRISASL